MKTTLFLYHKKIVVVGKENIPKKGAVLFIANHQNALIDPLLIATNNPRELYFLTRAAAFKNKTAKWWLSTVNMLPIYRIRDGKNELLKNTAIFNFCFNKLKEGKTVLIFPEGSHSLARKVRPLSKGFTRILFGAMDKYPDLNINIVPIGFNYEQLDNYASSVAIHYGKPINANELYQKEDLKKSVDSIKKICHTALTKLTTHIYDIANYAAILEHLDATNTNYLKPKKANTTIKNIDLNTLQVATKKKVKKHWLYYLVVLNNFIPWLVWKKYVQPKVDEVEFMSTFRFAIGISLAPILFALQTLLVYFFFGSSAALLYFAVSILLLFAYARLSNISFCTQVLN